MKKSSEIPEMDQKKLEENAVTKAGPWFFGAIATLAIIVAYSTLWSPWSQEQRLASLKEYLVDPTKVSSVTFTEQAWPGVGCIQSHDGLYLMEIEKIDSTAIGNFSKVAVGNKIISLTADHCMGHVENPEDKDFWEEFKTLLALKSVPGVDVAYQSPSETVKIDLTKNDSTRNLRHDRGYSRQYEGFAFPVTKKISVKTGDTLTVLSLKPGSGIVTPVKISGQCFITKKVMFQYPEDGSLCDEYDKVEEAQENYEGNKIAAISITKEMFSWAPGLSGSPVLHKGEVVGVVSDRCDFGGGHCLIVELVQENFFQ
jgi:hypothetical protein